MRRGSKHRTFEAIGRLFRTGTAAGLSDAQLLERFLLCHDEAAEAAFAALVERHGPMVLAVCRRVLNDPHDAQDALQATFLVLVRKAATIRKRGSLADWLHGVALRVSAHARADSARRRAIERRAGTESSIVYEMPAADREVWEEVEHLAQNLRAVVMLCYLEGLTHEQAARRLGWPVGTVRSRLARARDRLRTRLTRRGLAPDTAFLPMLSFRSSSLPEGLIDATVQAAMLIAARDAAEAGLVSASAAALTEGVLRTMLITKLKTAAVILMAAGAIASGVGLYAYQGPTPSPGKVEQAPSSPGRHDDAIRQPPAEDMEALRALQAVDFEHFAGKVEQMVRRARRALAEGDMDRAVRDLKEIESDATTWKDSLRARREGAQAGLPSTHTRAPGSVPPSPGANQAVPRPEPATSSLPSSSERRLDALEGKVDRLIRALDNDRREAGEPEAARTMPSHPAPPKVEGTIKKVDHLGLGGRVEINIGSDDGLIRGHELTIYRVDRRAQPVRFRAMEYIGRIRILFADPDQAVAKVIELWEGKKIKEGDCVTGRTPPIEGNGASPAAGQKK
jgi:RNA polymerase sigma factor (sigma-70 family)